MTFFGHMLYLSLPMLLYKLFSIGILEPIYTNQKMCSKLFTIKSFCKYWNNIYKFPLLSLPLFFFFGGVFFKPLKAQQLVMDQLGKTADKVKYLSYKFPLTIERKRQNILIRKHALLIGRQLCELCFGLWRRDGEYLKAFPFRNFRTRKMLILIY